MPEIRAQPETDRPPLILGRYRLRYSRHVGDNDFLILRPPTDPKSYIVGRDVYDEFAPSLPKWEDKPDA